MLPPTARAGGRCIGLHLEDMWVFNFVPLQTTRVLKSNYAVQNEVVQLLIENEANVNLATADNWTPVHDAARAGHVPVLRTLLAANADMLVTCVHN